MKIKILSSGSKGNSTYLESGNTKILIDAGINYNMIKKTLEEENIDVNSIDGVIISHTHSDHIGGLSSLIKKINTKVFIKEDLEKEIKKIIPKENIEIIEDDFIINDFEIKSFNTSHDVPNSGYIVQDKDSSFVYITDTGYINRKYIDMTSNKDVYMIEFNHDEKMVMEGPYPYILKERVLGDKGHLSNRASTNYLTKVVGENTKYIILAHMSENNNTEELAVKALLDKLPEYEDKLIVTKQQTSTKMIEI